MFATLNLIKPAGMTSHDVVDRVRKVLKLKKVGHLGTLDPVAEGVLPLCLDKATRLIEYFPDDKVYEASITFGRTTDTLDSEGKVLEETPCPQLTERQLEQALPAFRGTFDQRVPHYSAVHVRGKKLYHYVREGIFLPEEELPVRPVTLHELTLLDFQPGEFPVARVRAHCSSGTYMRSLARDIGKAVGQPAYLSHLTRTRHGLFDIADATPLAVFEAAEQPDHYFISPLERMSLPQIFVASDGLNGLIHGMTVDCPPLNQRIVNNDLAIARNRDYLAGIVQKVGHRLKPVKMLNVPLRHRPRPVPLAGLLQAGVPISPTD